MILRVKESNNNMLIKLLLILTSMNFLGVGNYIMAFLFVPVIIFFFHDAFVVVNTKIFLLLTGLTLVNIMFCSAASGTIDITDIVTTVMMPISAYLCGGTIIINAKDKKSALLTIVLLTAIGSLLFAFLSSLNKIEITANYSTLYKLNQQRISLSIWNGSQVGATTLAMYLLACIGSVFFYLFYMNGWKRLVMLIGFVLAAAVTFSIASRLNMVLIFVTFLCCFYLFLTNKTVANRKKIIRYMMLVVAVLVVAYVGDIWGFSTMIESSTLVQRLNFYSGNILESTGRLELYSYYVKSFFENPFGGISNKDGASTHNMLLQYASSGGILTLILAICFYIRMCVQVFIEALRNREDNIQFIVIPLTVIFIILCLIEAPIVSNPLMYSIFLMYLAMFITYYGCIKNNKGDNSL